VPERRRLALIAEEADRLAQRLGVAFVAGG
jgi:hypothetical protein